MSFKVFKPGANKQKFTIKNATSIPTSPVTGNVNSGGGGSSGNWVSIPVGSGWQNYSVSMPNGMVPVIDFDVESFSVEDFKDGCVCDSCKEFYPYAIPNQPDNKTLICFACRNGY